MTSVVVDASVAVKWCLPSRNEDYVEQAQELLEDCRRGSVRFVVPDFFWAEVTNALWKAVRRREISPENAESAIVALGDLGIHAVGTFNLLSQAFPLAVRHGRAVYDVLYVALALQLKTEMITADERLANALAAYLPVKWLGAI